MDSIWIRIQNTAPDCTGTLYTGINSIQKYYLNVLPSPGQAKLQQRGLGGDAEAGPLQDLTDLLQHYHNLTSPTVLQELCAI